MATPRRTFHPSTAHFLLATLALGLLVTAAGCATPIRADRIPQAFQAPRKTNVQETGLKNLVVPKFNSQMIDRGDVLEVTIVTDFGDMNSTTTPVRVERNGMANILLIGPVALAGFELDEAGPAIAAAAVARGVFRRPHVTVIMKRKRTNRITVIGAVEESTVCELPCGGSSLLAALVAAGGLAEDAGDEVVIRRAAAGGAVPGPMQPPAQHVAGGRAELAAYHQPSPAAAGNVEITRINLATAPPENSAAYQLRDGDVVMVGKRVPKPVYVIGLVSKPGEFEMPPNQDMYMLEAIAKAGERTLQVADRVLVIRRMPGHEQPVVIVASVNEAKHNGAANVRLAPGDIVSVEQTAATVFLDTMKSFLRFGFSSTIPLL